MLKIPFHTLVALLCAMLSLGALAQSESDHYEQGVQAYAQGEYPEAYIHLKNALQADPAFLPARLLLAKVHFNAGDVAGAAKESEEALALGADLNLVLPVYGTSLILLRRDADLFALEKQVGSLTNENRFEWLLLKGQGHLLRGEADAARRSFEQASAMFPTDVRSSNTLAAVYMQSGMRQEADELIEKSLLLDPDNVKTLELRADLALSEGHTDEALRSLEKAHELDSSDLRVLRGLARVHLLEGNQLQVEHYLALILEQSPNDPAATLLSAIIEIGKGEAEIGDAMLSGLSMKLAELDAISPQSSDDMQFIQASADYVRGSDRSAIALFNNYLTRKPSDLAAIRMLADLYIRNSETGRARDLLGSSRAYIVEDLGLSVLLLRLYIESGSEYNARELLEQLKAGTDDAVLVAVLEAELDRSVGKFEQALELLPERNYAQVPVSYGLLRGALLLDLNQLPAATAVARELQTAYPQQVRVQNFAAVAYLRQGDLENAEPAIDAALALARDDTDANFNLAVLLKQRGQLDDSAVVLNRILADRPSHVRSIMLMATILYDQGNVEEALDWSNKVYAYDKTSPLPGEFQLNVYTQTGNWEEARKTVALLSKDYPLNEDYLLRQAQIYMQLEDYELAQRPLRSLAALWAEDPRRLRQLAMLQVESQNTEEARLSLEAALRLAPEDFDIKLDLARLNILEGQYGRAQSQLDLLQESAGERSPIAQARGELALAQGQLEQAQAHFMRAYELDNSNGNAVGRLYELSLRGVGGEAFVATMESALQRDSLPPWAVRLLADSLMAQGNTARAARYYEALLAHDDFADDAGVLNNLANIYAADDLDKALVTAQRALALKREPTASILDTVGWIHTQRKEYDQALPFLRRAYTLNSRDPEIRYHTAVALLGLDRTAEAVKELRAALAAGEAFPGVDEARALLQELAP